MRPVGPRRKGAHRSVVRLAVRQPWQLRHHTDPDGHPRHPEPPRQLGLDAGRVQAAGRGQRDGQFAVAACTKRLVPKVRERTLDVLQIDS